MNELRWEIPVQETEIAELQALSALVWIFVNRISKEEQNRILEYLNSRFRVKGETNEDQN